MFKVCSLKKVLCTSTCNVHIHVLVRNRGVLKNIHLLDHAFRPFIFYKMFYGRAYPNFWQNEIKIKVMVFSFIFIFPSPCHKQHAHTIKLSTLLSKLNLQKQNIFIKRKLQFTDKMLMQNIVHKTSTDWS